jgi:hypothetical protein
MTRGDTYGPLPFFSRENWETFKVTYFFMAMCAICLVTFAIVAKFELGRDSLLVALVAAALSMVGVVVTLFLPGMVQQPVVETPVLQSFPPARRAGGASASVEAMARRTRAR